MSPFSILYCPMPACYICKGLSRRVTLPILVNCHLCLHLVKKIMTPVIAVVWTGGSEETQALSRRKPSTSMSLQPGLSFRKGKNNRVLSKLESNLCFWVWVVLCLLMKLVTLQGLSTCSAILFLLQRALGYRARGLLSPSCSGWAKFTNFKPL